MAWALSRGHHSSEAAYEVDFYNSHRITINQKPAFNGKYDITVHLLSRLEIVASHLANESRETRLKDLNPVSSESLGARPLARDGLEAGVCVEARYVS